MSRLQAFVKGTMFALGIMTAISILMALVGAVALIVEWNPWVGIPVAILSFCMGIGVLCAITYDPSETDENDGW